MRAFYTILMSFLICNCGGGDSTPPTSEETDAGPQISCGPNTILIDNVCWSKDEACDGEDDDGDGETDEGCPNWDEINITLHCDEGFAFENGQCVPQEVCDSIDNNGNGSIDEGCYIGGALLCHSDDDCVDAPWGPFCVPELILGVNICQACLQDTPSGQHSVNGVSPGCSGDLLVCAWGVQDVPVTDITPDGFAGFYWCVECVNSTDCPDNYLCLEQECIPNFEDADSDGYPSDVDCNDSDSSIHPDALEICDGIDNDCDNATDEGCPVQNHDQDNDGYSPFDGDCDDDDPNVNPGAIDWCDQLNNDCDDLMNEDDPNIGHPCTADLYDPATDTYFIVQGSYVCGEGGIVCAPPTLEECQLSDEICNDIFDDNCDGQVDEGCEQLSCETDDDCGAGGGCGCDPDGNFVCSGQSGLCVDGICETTQNVMECELGCNELGCLSECTETPTGPAEPGDVVKGTFDALYFISQEVFRYVVPNETMYLSWHYDNSCVKTITDQELADMPLAANVCMRYGTHLVKIQSIPIVYAVSTNCNIYEIADEQSAQELFGTNWQDRIYDVPDSFWPNYTIIGIDLFGSWYPDGFVLQVAGSDDVYLIWNEQKRLFASEQAFIDNRFQERFITMATQETLDFYPDGPDITGCEPDLVDDSQGGGGVCL